MRRINRILLLAVTIVTAVLGLTAVEPASMHGFLFIALAAGFFASDVHGRPRPRPRAN